MTGGLISGNTADVCGGGVGTCPDTVNITGGEVTGNSAYLGGGLYIRGGATLTGNPQIGGTAAPADGRAWVHDNSGGDRYP